MPASEEQQEILDVQAKYKVFALEFKNRFQALQTSNFSQSIEPVKSFLKLTPETKNGICQALVNRWIAAHAAEGSLWNEIYTSANGIPSLKIDVMKGLLAEFAEGISKSKTSMGPYQKLNTEVWLMRRGLIPRMTIADGQRMYEAGQTLDAHGKIDADANLGRKIVTALKGCRAHGRGEGSYAMISIKSAKGGHVMCAYLGGAAGANANYPYSDVAFFDPNFGEFWFDRGVNFGNFLTYFIGQRFYTRYGGFQIRNFATRARFAA